MRKGFVREGFALALVAGGAVWMALASEAMADSCSEHEDNCNNACFHRTGDAATLVFLQLQE